jgi:hypothetical protein
MNPPPNGEALSVTVCPGMNDAEHALSLVPSQLIPAGTLTTRPPPCMVTVIMDCWENVATQCGHPPGSCTSMSVAVVPDPEQSPVQPSNDHPCAAAACNVSVPLNWITHCPSEAKDSQVDGEAIPLIEIVPWPASPRNSFES